MVGKRYGRIRYRIPGAKRKSLEGSLAVAVAAGLGAHAIAPWLGVAVSGPTAIAAGVVAATAEAASPRATDNALVPLAVWAFLRSVIVV